MENMEVQEMPVNVQEFRKILMYLKKILKTHLSYDIYIC